MHSEQTHHPSCAELPPRPGDGGTPDASFGDVVSGTLPASSATLRADVRLRLGECRT